jgi:hypothetical protein
MAGTAPRDRAAIAFSFVAQAAMLLAALGIPVELSSSEATSSAAGSGSSTVVSSPLPVGEAFTPPSTDISGPITVTVTADGQSTATQFPAPAVNPQPALRIPAGEQVRMTVTITVPDGIGLSDFTLGIADGAGGPLKATDPQVQGSLVPGTYVFYLGWILAGPGDVLVLTGTQLDATVESTVATFGPS